jgi:hypothetical protein
MEAKWVASSFQTRASREERIGRNSRKTCVVRGYEGREDETTEGVEEVAEEVETA